MAKQIYQYVFMQNDSAQTWADVVSGAAFNNQFMNGVEAIGIQALPGTRFKLNGAPGWVIIGPTGIFELNLMDKSFITSLSFDAASVRNMMDGPSGVALLVDIIYQGD